MSVDAARLERARAREVWDRIHGVRIWLETALERARSAAEGGIVVNALTRGRLGRAKIEEAFEAIRQAALALIDLEFAQHQAEMDRVQLRIMQLDRAKRVTPDRLVEVLASDIATLDALAGAVEVLQRHASA